MANIAFTVEIDGQESASNVDVSFDAIRFSLREMVRVEEALGSDMAERFVNGDLPFTPRTFQALLWAKLASQFPEIGINDFDIPGEAFSELGRAVDPPPPPVAMKLG